MLRRLITSLALVVALVATAPARAQDDPYGGSYVTPFPENDVYKVEVIGQWLAEGLLNGLSEAMSTDTRVQINKKRRGLEGLMQNDFETSMIEFDEELRAETVHVAVVMMGENDRIALKNETGKRVPVGSEPWKEMYGRRVDRFMKLLKKRKIAVYWVGLPNLRSAEANEQAQSINDILRERAYINGVKYIDAFAGFIDEQGGYNAHGPDLTGKVRLLRQPDGIYFTQAGNQKLANFVERELKRDLTQAKADRNVPLAGDEGEQARVNPAKVPEKPAASAAAGAATPGKSAAPADPQAAADAVAAAPVAPESNAQGDQKLDTSKINLRIIHPNGKEENVPLEIVRPAIPASVVQLMTRKESTERASQMGDTIADPLPGGLTMLSSITPASGGAGGAFRAKQAPTQTPFFRVLVKGEKLAPKPGRADDFTWPRPEPPPVIPAKTGALPAAKPAKPAAPPEAAAPASQKKKTLN